MEEEMDGKTMLLWVLVAIMTFWGVARFFLSSVDGSGGGIIDRQLQLAFESAVTTVDCGYSDVGYTYFSPSEAAQNYLALLEADRTEMTEIRNDLNAPTQQVLPHHIGEPSEPWSIVLKPDNSAHTLQILAFGDDLKSPQHQSTLECETSL